MCTSKLMRLSLKPCGELLLKRLLIIACISPQREHIFEQCIVQPWRDRNYGPVCQKEIIAQSETCVLLFFQYLFYKNTLALRRKF